jgi:hypothetical protein
MRNKGRISDKTAHKLSKESKIRSNKICVSVKKEISSRGGEQI